MPYYVFKIHPGKRLELVQSHDMYPTAKMQVRDLRAALTPPDEYNVRVIFAKNSTEAERLILTERPFQLTGED